MRNNKKRGLVFLMGLLMTVSLTSCSGSTAADTSGKKVNSDKLEINIAGASSTGQITRWVLALCNVINAHSELLTANCIVTGGSAENVDLINSGEVDMGVVNSPNLYMGINGLGGWDGRKAENLTYVAACYPEYFYGATTADSNINEMNDIKGHIVNLDTPINAVSNQMILDVVGLTSDQFTVSTQIVGDAMTSISEGSIDIHIASTGASMTAVAQAASSAKGLKIVGFSEEQVKQICDELPFYIPCKKDDFYGGAEAGIASVWVPEGMYTLTANRSLPENAVNEIVRIMNEYHDEVVAGEATAEPSIAENAVKFQWFDFHPGAEAYYKEIGLQ